MRDRAGGPAPNAARLEGLARHCGVHAAGVVIAPDRLTRYVPLQRATKGILITQYDMYPIEDLSYGY